MEDNKILTMCSLKFKTGCGCPGAWNEGGDGPVPAAQPRAHPGNCAQSPEPSSEQRQTIVSTGEGLPRRGGLKGVHVPYLPKVHPGRPKHPSITFGIHSQCSRLAGFLSSPWLCGPLLSLESHCPTRSRWM